MKGMQGAASIQFHDKAREIFFSVYNRFSQSVSTLDRTLDENVFQKLQAQYCYELKQRLEATVLDVLANMPADERDGSHGTLTFLASEYVTEFMQKAKSL